MLLAKSVDALAPQISMYDFDAPVPAVEPPPDKRRNPVSTSSFPPVSSPPTLAPFTVGRVECVCVSRHPPAFVLTNSCA
jgi:hypothetical protein